MSFPYRYDDAGRAVSKRAKARNDCTVRAVALAFDIPYDRAYDILAEAGRKSGKGFDFRPWAEKAEVDGKRLIWLGFKAVRGQQRCNPVSFTDRYRTGRWIARTAKHVFAVVDGVVLDDHQTYPERCIYGAWRVASLTQD